MSNTLQELSRKIREQTKGMERPNTYLALRVRLVAPPRYARKKRQHKKNYSKFQEKWGLLWAKHVTVDPSSGWEDALRFRVKGE